jgi:hypothetical protein
MKVLLISTDDLGRQPFGLASPAAWLRAAGAEVACLDLAVDSLETRQVEAADLIGFSLPMHTATRIALEHLPRIRKMNPHAHLCAYGLYVPLAAGPLREAGVETLLGPEFEPGLLTLWRSLTGGTPVPGFDARALPRVAFRTPDRTLLPAADRYARLRSPDGDERLVGTTEASRGCLHGCRHCPIVPVYGRRFRAVPVETVLADVDAQVERGVRHITFSDPDFLNGPRHALRITESLHRRHPTVSYDVTIKVEHLLRDPEMVQHLRDTGCCLVTSAVESFDDRVLRILDKGHTVDDVYRLATMMSALDLALQPTFLAFHPWMSLAGYRDFLDHIARLGWVGQVSAIQLAIRLLVPAGSTLLDLEEVRRRVGALDDRALVHPWAHDDPRVDALQIELERRLGGDDAVGPSEAWQFAWAAVHDSIGVPAPVPARPLPARATIPYLTEPWYC